MSVLIKVFIGSVVGVLTVGLLGCGCLYPFMPQRPNLYSDVYKAEALRYDRKYRKAIGKYEQASKKLPRFPTETKVIHVRFPTFFTYGIAFCYAKLAEVEKDVSLYVKAEAAARESYETAILPSDQADALYLWGYILFKQARYEEALAKFEETLIGTVPLNRFGADFTAEVLYGLGKAHLELGDKAAARQAFVQFEEQIQIILQTINSFYAEQALYELGKVYLEFGDEFAARRVFVQLFEIIKIELQDSFIGYDAEIFYRKTLYELGKTYLAFGDKAAARQAFGQLEVRIEINLQDGHSSAEDDLYELGKAYLELGDEFAARRVFAQLRVHFPKLSYKAEMKRLLEKQ